MFLSLSLRIALTCGLLLLLNLNYAVIYSVVYSITCTHELVYVQGALLAILTAVCVVSSNWNGPSHLVALP